MIKDRGNIKWNSLMLVEHKKRLRELKKKEKEKEKPVLDEQEKERLNYILQKAYKQKSVIEITFYENRDFRTIRGRIKDCYAYKGELIIENDEKPVKVKVEMIVGVSPV